MVQPSSVDVRLDRYFRLFDNHKYPFIDPAVDQPDLTHLIEVAPDEPFILHPGEFALGSTFELISLPDDIAARLEGKSSLGRLGLLDALDGRLHRPRLLGSRHARAVERRDAADQALAGHEDRPALLLPPVLPRRGALWLGPVRQQVSRSARADGIPVGAELPPHRRRRERCGSARGLTPRSQTSGSGARGGRRRCHASRMCRRIARSAASGSPAAIAS